jgi:Mn-dependent DtxR family transcriptional regulator
MKVREVAERLFSSEDDLLAELALMEDRGLIRIEDGHVHITEAGAEALARSREEAE